jgi:hypothetical protein
MNTSNPTLRSRPAPATSGHPHPHPHPQRPPRLPRAALAVLAAAALAACGGGTDRDEGLSNEQAQGYAADAATMPVAAGTAVGAATLTLQSAVAASGTASAKTGGDGEAAAAGADAPAQAQDTGPTTTVPCALGGTVRWVASGLPLAQLVNRRLDAGETYDITYTNCGTAITGVVLDGSLRVVVNAADPTGFDFTTTATALSSTTLHGRYVLDGTWRHQLAVTTTAGGGTQRVDRLATTLATLTSTVGTRQARYELRRMDWTTTDLWSAGGQPVSRSHNGALELFASTPRRPSATLQVATIGTLVIGADGLADSGGFSVVAGGDKWSVTYGATTVTIALDLGNDGSVERTWTLPRLAFHGEAG